jgi:hypothetical protein
MCQVFPVCNSITIFRHNWAWAERSKSVPGVRSAFDSCQIFVIILLSVLRNFDSLYGTANRLYFFSHSFLCFVKIEKMNSYMLKLAWNYNPGAKKKPWQQNLLWLYRRLLFVLMGASTCYAVAKADTQFTILAWYALKKQCLIFQCLIFEWRPEPAASKPFYSIFSELRYYHKIKVRRVDSNYADLR